MNKSMNMSRIVMAALLAPVIALQVGCATTGSDPSPALELARAGGLKKLRDVEADSRLSPVRGKAKSDVTDAVTVAALATDVVDPLTGWSNLAEAGLLGGVSLLASLPSWSAENYGRFLVWMPRSVGTEDEAASHLKDTIIGVYQRAMPDYEVSWHASTYRLSKGSTEIALRGPKCLPEPCIIEAPQMLERLEPPKTGVAPRSLGGYEAYTWPSSGGLKGASSSYHGLPYFGGTFTAEERVELARRISEEMPPWMMLYVPPSKGFTAVPIIVDHGKPLFFVKQPART